MSDGLLLVWNDIEARRQVEYDCWHAIEHVPERTWVPGFRRGTRYSRASGDGPMYFTAYELESLACLESAEYELLVKSPTRWSASMRPSFRNFLRRTYESVAAEGGALACTAWVRRLVFATDIDPSIPPEIGREIARVLRRLGASACVTRVQIGHQRAMGAQALVNSDAAPAGDEYVFIVECARPVGWDAMHALLRQVTEPRLPQPIWTSTAEYGFLSSVLHDEVQDSTRPQPQDDLAAQSW